MSTTLLVLDIHILALYFCVRKADFMRTNVVIDDKLIEEGLEYTGFKTKKELVNYALKKLVDRKKRKTILELEGKLDGLVNLYLNRHLIRAFHKTDGPSFAISAVLYYTFLYPFAVGIGAFSAIFSQHFGFRA